MQAKAEGPLVKVKAEDMVQQVANSKRTPPDLSSAKTQVSHYLWYRG